MNTADVYVLSARRTPIGALMGQLSTFDAASLGSIAIKAAIESAHNQLPDSTQMSGCLIDAVYMGTVLGAGQGQAPARQAAIKAGLPWSVPATTINKMCGSGMQSAICAFHQLSCSHLYAIAGGMESMSNAPHLLRGYRQGRKLGDTEILDSIFSDGLEDAFLKGLKMGDLAEDIAIKHGIDREQQDEYALLSLKRAQAAAQKGHQTGIVAVNVETRKDSSLIEWDELPGKADFQRIPLMQPVFRKKGTITAANASAISDGAAALVLSSHPDDQKHALVRWAGYANFACESHLYPTAPIGAVQKLLVQLGWDIKSIDLFEVNEAFAIVPLAFQQALNIPTEKLNSQGGACAIGHPIGASGARIMVTLIHTMIEQNLHRGIATVCIGGGEALAVAFERG